MCVTKYLHPARYLTYIMHSKQLLTVFVQISCLIGPSYGTDGSTCPFFCPTNSCPRDHTLCSGGSYENGCIKPDSCISSEGNIPLLVFEIYDLANCTINQVKLEQMEPFVQLIVPKLAPWITSLVLMDLIIMAAHRLTLVSQLGLHLVITK